MDDSGNLNDIFSARANPSRQYLLGKLFDYRQRLDLFAASNKPDDGTRAATLMACHNYIAAIEITSTEGKFFWKKKPFSAWHLFHRLDETFYLLMNVPELRAQGIELQQGYKISSLPQQTKTEWLAKIESALKKLEAENVSDDAAHEVAHLFKSAVYVYNDYVDNLFWDIWCKKFIALIHTFFLMLLMGGFFVSSCFSGGISLSMGTVLLLGAMGGLGSGILTFQPVAIAYGHFWSVTLYHTFIRPLQGAMAALMTFWLLQSQYLIAIDPPLKPGTRIVTSAKGLPCEFPVVVTAPRNGVVNARDYVFSKATTAAFTRISTVVHNNQTITLKAAEGMQIYLYLLVLLIAGFSGDKVLKTVTDKVSNKLFSEAEKTKDGK